MNRNPGLQRGKALRFTTLVVLCTASITSSAARVTYDRAWWNATDTDRRAEFLAGYGDCAFYELGDTGLANAQWNVIEPEITRYYSIHAKTEEKVPALYVRLGSGRPPSTDPAPEVYPGPHGFFDGDYWRQLSEPERTGFVEGYLACYESRPRGRGMHDHSIEWYVDKVSAFYCFTGKTCADEHVSENERVVEKIANVLHRLEAQ